MTPYNLYSYRYPVKLNIATGFFIWYSLIMGGIIYTNQTQYSDLDIAKGHMPNTRRWGMIGRTPEINSESDVWYNGGLYGAMDATTAETMEIFSSDADDNATGLGARTVLIQGLLDEDYNQMPDVVVTLDGTNPVSLGAQTYLRGGTSIIVLTGGADGINKGNITLRHTTTTTNIFGYMPIGENQSEVCAFTVPAGSTLYINTIYVSMIRTGGQSGSASVSGLIRPFGGVWNTVTHPEITSDNGYEYSNGGYYVIPEKADLKLEVRSTSNNQTIVSGDVYGLLESS